MPSATFFRLPEEKRKRLIDAAWAEFTACPFDRASINRIIKEANISRGSFYQYFTDKDDLFHFLLGDLCGSVEQAMEEETVQLSGDLFAACLAGYDWVVAHRNDAQFRLPEVVRLAQMNPRMEFELNLDTLRAQRKKVCAAASVGYQNHFRQGGGITVQDYLELLCLVTGSAVMASFRRPEDSAKIREKLKKQFQILKYGMLETAEEGDLNA